MRTNYDFVKTENKKLNDSLDTQHKLWKVWLEKMDVKKDKSVPVTKSNEESTKVNEAVEEVEITEIRDDDGVDTEEVFQQFITNKERGFKRTSPTVSAVPNKPKPSDIRCETCGYTASNKQALSDHIIRVHKITKRTEDRTKRSKRT